MKKERKNDNKSLGGKVFLNNEETSEEGEHVDEQGEKNGRRRKKRGNMRMASNSLS